MKIVVLERHSVGQDVSVEEIEKLGEVTVHNNLLDEDEIIKNIKEAEIIVANKAPLNRRVLSEAVNLKMVSELATGFDNVDVEYCRENGILVNNVRNYSTDSVAQHTFALLFYIQGKLRYYDDFVKNGDYGKSGRFSNFDSSFCEIAGKTWGIIGMGNIGKKVADIAKAFGCKVIFHSLTGKSSVTEYEQVSFEDLLERSDILSLHCPLSDLSRGLINYEALCKMKKTAYLINVARGPVVVDADLARALKENLIAGAGLDVTGTEPLTIDNPLSQIKDSNKLYITPHLAWASVEARTRCVSEVAENIKAYQRGEKRNIVWE